LYGHKLHADELLKVSQTALEAILAVEKEKQTEGDEASQSRRRSASISQGAATGTGGLSNNGVTRKRKNTL